MVIPVSLCKSAAKKVVEELSTILLDKYNLYSSFKDDLIKLTNDMSAISAVLLDAEKKQEKNHLVEDWLKKLRDVLYDAEDLLDDINAQVLRQKVEAEWRIVSLVRNMFFFSDIDDRIKKIIVRVDEIANRISSLHLQQLDQQVADPNRQRENNTNSYMRCCTEVVGRDEDEKRVIERLLGGCSNSNNVVPIVGIGGLGKTALVNLVFDNDRVKNDFDLRIWVDVSDDLNSERIWQKKVVRAIDRSDENICDIDFLSSCLRMSEKKFLLVLDDVWDCNRVEWLDLKKLLVGNDAKESRIVATTRYKSTASVMGENENENSLYQLGALADDDCKALFEEWAFGEGESVQLPNLVKIGEEIVMKCRGVPLAIRTVGGLLSGTKEESYWMSVKNSDTWSMSSFPEKEDGIMSVLKLSYDRLPSPFKECFAYCSLLVKGKEFDKQDLIHLWMAQGFIQPSNSDQQLEDVGTWYINEFVSRSIFDVVLENHKTEIVKCKMHDLFHDLAKLVAGNLMVKVNSDTSNISENTRHISFENQEDVRKDPSSFLKLPKLRTLLLVTKLGPHLNVFLSGSTYLRALDLSYMGITHLPNSIGNMKHLRYLNLNGNNELRFLPDSICGLHYLQTLKLSGCIKISTFPRNFSHLVSLRHLVVTSPNVFEKQLGTLTSLRSLTIEHCRNLVSLTEVTQNLTCLRTLRIHNCDKLTSLPSSLKNCTALENLEVVNCPKMESLDVCIANISSLRSITIQGLRKLRTLPIKPEFYASSLQYLLITNCISLMTLPDCVRNLSSLMRIQIRYCPNLLSLPCGFGHLTSLQVLQIVGCPLLSTKCRRIDGEDWEKIRHVREIYVDKVRV